MCEQLKANAEATLERHCQLWQEQPWGKGLACHDEPGYTPQAWLDAQKKTLAASERDEQARGAWLRRLSAVDPRRLVFVDEYSTKCAWCR